MVLKCPTCGEKLKPITGSPGEWVCDNSYCPNNKGEMCYAEFYGKTQKKINSIPHEDPIFHKEPTSEAKHDE